MANHIHLTVTYIPSGKGARRGRGGGANTHEGGNPQNMPYTLLRLMELATSSETEVTTATADDLQHCTD